MWTAFKSDLLDFVNTITDDTTKTISKVIGETDGGTEEDEVTIREKMLTDVRRSFLTYNTVIEDIYSKEYEKYLKNFSLSSFASEIANVLDLESDVSRFYAELVPISLKPEEFWSRYFFRVILINRNGVVNLDDDDEEEEIQWESAEKDIISPCNSPLKADNSLESLLDENIKLKKQVKSLVSRITFLENTLIQKDQIIASLKPLAHQITVPVVEPVIVAEKFAAVNSSAGSIPDDPVCTASLDASESSQSPSSTSDDDSIVVVAQDGNYSSTSSLVDVSKTPLAEYDSPTDMDAAMNATKCQTKEPAGVQVIKSQITLDDDEEEDGWS